MASICESGIINAEGKMRLPMDRVNAFFQANKGKRLIIRFEAEEHGSTEAQLAYYFNYIIPTIRQALYEIGERKTDKQIDLWLRQQCSSCYDENGDLLTARQISKPDFSDFIDWIKQTMSETLYIYIEDSQVI